MVLEHLPGVVDGSLLDPLLEPRAILRPLGVILAWLFDSCHHVHLPSVPEVFGLLAQGGDSDVVHHPVHLLVVVVAVLAVIR